MISNTELVELSAVSMIQILGKVTSPGYAKIVMSSVIDKLASDHPVLAYVRISEDDHVKTVTVSQEVDSASDEDLGAALTALIGRVEGLARDYPFRRELWFYLNPHESRLRSLGVEIEQ